MSTDNPIGGEQADIDPLETQEWLDALVEVMAQDGPQRGQFLLNKLKHALQGKLPNAIDDAWSAGGYINTIFPQQEIVLPEDERQLLMQLVTIMRWNALAMVVRTGKKTTELGGHIASYTSISLLYEVGFNYYFRGRTEEYLGDLIYFQGHSSPGIYARAFLEGRLSQAQLDNFRQETGHNGVSSYPHPWLMPDFWQFPTVSMGLGPIQAIYQARFLKYLQHRRLLEGSALDRKVWAFCGDGEMDEPESLGAITVAVREQLDNLIFVVNCNLQRLDGLVRGNGKIIQELAQLFRGAGWRVIKVIWDSHWDTLLAKDSTGALQARMQQLCDGDYQRLNSCDGATLRKEFFGVSEELLALVADYSDSDLEQLGRGGHDPQKVYAAYAVAMQADGRPTVLLAKTVKGYGMGALAEGQNIAHQQKKMTVADLQQFCSRFSMSLTEQELEKAHFVHPPKDGAIMRYMQDRRKALGGFLPQRQSSKKTLLVPDLSQFKPLLEGSGERTISTTMAWVRLLGIVLRDRNIGPSVVPIVPDEARTFGMEGLFRQVGIYSSQGQRYQPIDRAQIMYYKEAQDGQLLQEGLNEAGAMCSWIAAATSYSSNDLPLIPMYIYYSMFGFQRIGDLAWAAADMRARGFLLGATAGRTTLCGEGLQHQDGHSPILASTIPNCRAYDPTFSYEVAVIMQHGMQHMYQEHYDGYYYITLMNENYLHPPIPKGDAVREGIIKGLYKLKSAASKPAKPCIQLLGCGTILLQVLEAAALLQQDYGISAEVWSVTSFNELRREALAVERHNQLHPQQKPKLSYVTRCLQHGAGPVVAATDYMRLFADQIRAFVPNPYYVLGTDGFGRSDTRQALRRFFEVDAQFIAYISIKALVDQKKLHKSNAMDALKRYKIDGNKVDPVVS